MIDEPLPIEHPVHTLPPFRTFQQFLILPEHHFIDGLKSRLAYCGAHFLNAEDLFNTLPNSPLDLAKLVEWRGEIGELVSEICIGYDAAYDVVLDRGRKRIRRHR